MPGWRDGDRTLIARVGVCRFLGKCYGVQDCSERKETDDLHGFILPLNIPES